MTTLNLTKDRELKGYIQIDEGDYTILEQAATLPPNVEILDMDERIYALTIIIEKYLARHGDIDSVLIPSGEFEPRMILACMKRFVKPRITT